MDSEQRARELLAEELDLMSPTLADDVRAGNEKPRSPTAAALRAITRALEQREAATPPRDVPEGWKLVPVEATEAMLMALVYSAAGNKGWRAGYRAMLAAAPEPHKENE